MSEQHTKDGMGNLASDQQCIHEEVEHEYFKTACGSHYSCDEQNDPFVFCPYCGKDIEEGRHE